MNTKPAVDFSDLEDPSYGVTASGQVRPLSDEQLRAAAAPRYAANLAHRPGPMGPTDAPEHEVGHRETCLKCGGTGSFRGYTGRLLGSCFACKGAGFKVFKTSSAERAQTRAVARDRKIETMNANGRGFAEQFPDVHGYLLARIGRWDFAQSMLDAATKYGHLTENQMAAVRSAMERDAAKTAERAAQAASAPTVGDGIAPLKASLETAKASGLKRVRLMTPQFTFSLAKDSGTNPGAIYVKAPDGAYLGKITPDGRLQTSYEGRSSEAAIVEVCKDPLAAAKLYGVETGRCGCCGRELTDPESIAAGIGPVCAGRFGW